MENGSTIAIFEHLNRHSVPFVVIGGHAVNYYGYIRATEDFDIIFLRTEQSEKDLCNALTNINACWLSNQIDPATGIEKEIPITLKYIQTNHLMMLCTKLGYLDIFDFVPEFPEESVEALFDSGEELNGVRFISLQWLRKIKGASKRPRDLDDLENLPER